MRYEHHGGGIPTIELAPGDTEPLQEEPPVTVPALLEAAWRELGGES